MSDVLREVVAFERISVIARLGSMDTCNAYERQVILNLIADLAEATNLATRKYKQSHMVVAKFK